MPHKWWQGIVSITFFWPTPKLLGVGHASSELTGFEIVELATTDDLRCVSGSRGTKPGITN
jgi:hypothetical protein